MRARSLLALAAFLLLDARPLVAAGEPLRFETPPKIDGLKLVDVDGDGQADVVTLSGRVLSIWTRAKDAPPSAAPRWSLELPVHVSFVDVSRVDRPSVLCLGAEGCGRLALDRAGPDAWMPIPNAQPLGWRDGAKAVFANLHPGPASNSTCVVPGPKGWRLEPGWPTADPDIRVPMRQEVTPAGPFLEDVATVKFSMPPLLTDAPQIPVVGHPTGSTLQIGVLWGLFEDALSRERQASSKSRTRYDLSFLPTTGVRRILDLDGNGTPDVVHGDGDNREVKYAFFRVPPPNADEEWAPRAEQVGPDLRPPAAFLRLSGFNLEPDAVDLNADGLQDFVVTTIAVDHQNTLRAVTTGKVTATTLAFLQRKQAPDSPMFASQPDATVTSEIGVRVRFGYAGTIDVQRSFTILTTADLDGDGRKDLVIRVGPGTLAIRKGTAEAVWTAEPTLVEIPPLAAGEEVEAYGANLDGKPGDELLLLYRAPEGQPDRLLLLR